MSCKNEDCEMFPHYGLAPHTHDLSSGSFIGSTRTSSKDKWPDNFVEDKEEPGLGTWYCPECKSGFQPESKTIKGE